ncbi:MetQ/NlpA family ABC transporter substrate-binding protein [Ectobacillus sp. sgz5001026]|uniref:MetQ/NlpA family ABC transporter substrate-binding protein n=1 Tax=Ectobacillus sp. sgz5001026 TaxID=3242473 RepID=UPI0036D20AE3
MRKFGIILSVLVLVFVISGCGKSVSSENKVIKVGIRSSEIKTWNYIADLAKKEGLTVEIVNFNSTIDPNTPLNDGEIDVNAFQHISYLDQFNAKHNTKIVPIGTTIIAPLGIYSSKYKSLKDIPDGSKIAIPNDQSNWGRSLLLLQEAGLIKVVDNFNGDGGADKIKENPKKLDIVPVDGATTPRVMQDVAASVINNGTALTAGLKLKDSLFHESKTAKPYINIIAAREKDKDRPELKKLVSIYQSKEVTDFIDKTYEGNYIPTFISLEELAKYKETFKNNK